MAGRAAGGPQGRDELTKTGCTIQRGRRWRTAPQLKGARARASRQTQGPSRPVRALCRARRCKPVAGKRAREPGGGGRRQLSHLHRSAAAAPGRGAPRRRGGPKPTRQNAPGFKKLKRSTEQNIPQFYSLAPGAGRPVPSGWRAAPGRPRLPATWRPGGPAIWRSGRSRSRSLGAHDEGHEAAGVLESVGGLLLIRNAQRGRR